MKLLTGIFPNFRVQLRYIHLHHKELRGQSGAKSSIEFQIFPLRFTLCKCKDRGHHNCLFEFSLYAHVS